MTESSANLASLLKRRGIWIWLGLYVLGTIVARSINAYSAIGVIVPAVLAACLTLGLVLRNRSVTLAMVLISALALGAARQARMEESHAMSAMLLERVDKEPRRLIIRLLTDPEKRPAYDLIWARVESIWVEGKWTPARAGIRLSVAGDVEGLYKGDMALALAKLSAPSNFRNPGAFDYVEYLRRRGVAVTAWAEGPDRLVKIDSGWFPNPWAMIGQVRSNYVRRLHRLGGPGGTFLAAILAGDRSGLDPEIESVFERAGLSHLLAISGLHLGLAAAFCFFLFRRLARLFPRLLLRIPDVRFAAMATIPPVVVYALLTGMRLPTQRALVMVLAYLFAIALDKSREVWNTLALAAAAVLFAWPAAYLEISFQLSFVCVAGIIYAAPRIDLLLSRERSEAAMELDRLEAAFGVAQEGPTSKIRDYLRGLLIVTLSAQAFIFPLTANNFHTVNWASPLYNLIAVPFCGLVLIPVGLVSSPPIPLYQGLGETFLHGLALFSELFIEITRKLVDSFDPSILTPPLPGWAVVAWYASVFALLEGGLIARTGKIPAASFGFRPRVMSGALIIMGVLLFAVSCLGFRFPPYRLPEGKLCACALDVGQGQSILVKGPGGAHILVDGGGFYRSDWDVGKGIVAPCLLNLGVTRLDAVALSHPHPDHGKGLVYIVSRFDVGELWLTREHSDLSEAILEKARARGIPVKFLDADSQAIQLGKMTARVFHPPAEHNGGYNLNDRSMVLKITAGDSSVLLTGDVEEKAERELTRLFGPSGAISPGALSSQAMTVPHHGSGTSSTPEFIEAVSPSWGLVSAAGADRTGLPLEAIIKRYESRSVSLYRTDLDGFVGICLEGDAARPITFE